MEDIIKATECIVTWQGEGCDSGKRMLLIRVRYCSREKELRACKFCDTIIKQRNSLESEYKLKDLQKIINEEKTGLLVTGGECTYDLHFNDTVKLLNNLTYPICNVETNGYDLINLIPKIDPIKNVIYIYSPKIFSIDDLKTEIERTKRLKDFKNVCFKVVYQKGVSVMGYLEFLTTLKDINNRVYLMPEGKNRKELLQNAPEVFDICESRKFNFSSRDHIIYEFV